MELVKSNGFQHIIPITIVAMFMDLLFVAMFMDLLFVAMLLCRFCSFKLYTTPEYIDPITTACIYQRAHTQGHGGDPEQDREWYRNIIVMGHCWYLG